MIIYITNFTEKAVRVSLAPNQTKITSEFKGFVLINPRENEFSNKLNGSSR